MAFKNLAENRGCDEVITRELIRAGIPSFVLPQAVKEEVPYRVYGLLHGLKFTRAWYYWRVEGFIPLEVAEILYEDPVYSDIRANGDAGGPSPLQAMKRVTPEGKVVLDPKEWKELVKWAKQDPRFDLSRSIAANPFETPVAYALPCVGNFHIDSELALRVFADAVKNNADKMNYFLKKECHEAVAN